MVAVSTIIFIVDAFSPLPAADYWRVLPQLEYYLNGKGALLDLFRLHNEHCIFFPKILMLVDLKFFHGTNMFLFASCFLLQAMTCAMLIYEARKTSFLTKNRILFLAAIYISLLLSLGQYENFIWSFAVQVILVYTAGVGAAVCLVKYISSIRMNKEREVFLLLSMACAVVATMSNANGILIFLPLLAIALLSKIRPRDFLVILAVLFIMLLVLYLLGSFEQKTGFAATFQNARRAYKFFATCLGSPFSITQKAAFTFGIIGLFLAVIVTFRCIISFQRLSDFYRSNFAIMCLAILSIFSITVGRFEIPFNNPLTSRYLTPALIFWTCLLSLLLYEAGHSKVSNWMVPLFIIIFLAIYIKYLLPVHSRVFFSECGRGKKQILEEAGLALVTGANDKKAIGKLFFFSEEVLDVVPILRERHWSVFHYDWSDLIGQPLSSRFREASGKAEGKFASAVPLPVVANSDLPKASLTVKGWAMNSDKRPFPLILVVDQSGIIRGIARSRQQGLEFFTRYALKQPFKRDWFGYAVCEKNSILQAYAVDPGSSTVSLLDGKQAIHEAGEISPGQK